MVESSVLETTTRGAFDGHSSLASNAPALYDHVLGVSLSEDRVKAGKLLIGHACTIVLHATFSRVRWMPLHGRLLDIFIISISWERIAAKSNRRISGECE